MSEAWGGHDRGSRGYRLLILALFAAGFFAAHATASGWIPAIAHTGRAQASSLYNLAYYGGSSLFGWAIGLAFQPWGWLGVVATVGALILLAMVIAAFALGRDATGSPSRASL